MPTWRGSCPGSVGAKRSSELQLCRTVPSPARREHVEHRVGAVLAVAVVVATERVPRRRHQSEVAPAAVFGDDRHPCERHPRHHDQPQVLRHVRGGAVELVEQGGARRAGRRFERPPGQRSRRWCRPVVPRVPWEHPVIDRQRGVTAEEAGQSHAPVSADELVVLRHRAAGRESPSRDGDALHGAPQLDLVVEQLVTGAAVLRRFARKREVHRITPGVAGVGHALGSDARDPGNSLPRSSPTPSTDHSVGHGCRGERGAVVSDERLAGRRVLVVGASTGIGARDRPAAVRRRCARGLRRPPR